MTNQSDIPGMENGMFFEHYVFDPLSNFQEEDLYHIVKFFHATFDEVVPPHPRHFDGRVFNPQQDITVSEFADILTESNLTVDDNIMTKLPKSLQEQFEDGKFVPFDDFGLDNLIEFLMKLLNFRLGTTDFNTLPQRMKRQFVIATRDGKSWRYGDRTP